MPNGINISDFVRKVDNLSRIYGKIPDRAATIAVAFSKDRFREQAWTDNVTEPWRKRKENARQRRSNRGRGILIKSGRLKRSIRKIYVGTSRAIIGTDVPYASAHNYGFKGKVNVGSHKRGKYDTVRVGTGTFNVRTRTERTRSARVASVSRSEVQAHSRQVTLPRRQFIGESNVLAKRIERDITAQILRGLKS